MKLIKYFGTKVPFCGLSSKALCRAALELGQERGFLRQSAAKTSKI